MIAEPAVVLLYTDQTPPTPAGTMYVITPAGVPVIVMLGGVYWASVSVTLPEMPVELRLVSPPNAVSSVVKFALTGTSHVLTLLPLAGVLRLLFVVAIQILLDRLLRHIQSLDDRFVRLIQQ